MEDNAGKLAGILLSIGIFLAIPSDSFGNQKKKGDRMERAAELMWKTFKSPGYFLEADIDTCREDPECYRDIAEKWRKADAEEKAQAMDLFTEIGGQWKPQEGDKPRRYGPFLVEEHLIEVVVEALSHEEPEIRSLAARILAKETPDSIVRDHAKSIEKAVAMHPEITDGARLIGKLGSGNALKILMGSKPLQEDDPFVLHAVFGKLGDPGRENNLIDAYRKATDPRVKRKLALLLGYMAKPKSLMVLARDIRTPFFYEWNQKGRRSFRLHVIEALSLAYPTEPLLWKPHPYPSGDEYYSEIEVWAERVLGVEWLVPRPPFLYEEQVPIAKPGMGR